MKPKLIGILIIILFQSVLSAQIVSEVSLSKDTIGIGESVDVIFKLLCRNPQQIKHVDFSSYDSIQSIAQQDQELGIEYFAEVDWIAPFAEDNFKKIILNPTLIKSISGGTEYIDTFQATFWDTGLFPIEHPKIIVQDSVDDEVMKMQATLLLVSKPMEGIVADSTSAILPIKPIIKEAKNLSDYLLFIIAILGFLIIGGLLYYFLRPKPVEVINTRTIRIPTSHELALNKLAILDKKGLWQRGEVKGFQSELTFIIREYLEKRFGINALESTTGQIKRALKDQELNLDQENNLTEILQIADMVKFAKAKPEDEIHAQFLNKAKDFVEQSKNPDEEERTEEVEIRKVAKVTNQENITARTVEFNPDLETRDQPYFIDHTEEIRYASPLVRFLAYTIDMIIIAAISAVVILPLLYFELLDLSQVNYLIIGFLSFGIIVNILFWIYPMAKYRKTLGMKFCKIEICKLDESNISILNGFGRLILLSLASLLFWIPALTIFFNKKNQTLYDKLLKTVIIKSNVKATDTLDLP